MKRSWIPTVPEPRIGKRVTHLVAIPDPVEKKPLAELRINSKIVKPLEVLGIVTVEDLASTSSEVLAKVKQISLKVIQSFKKYCAKRNIPVTVRVGQVKKLRIQAKAAAELRAAKLKSNKPDPAI